MKSHDEVFHEFENLLTEFKEYKLLDITKMNPDEQQTIIDRLSPFENKIIVMCVNYGQDVCSYLFDESKNNEQIVLYRPFLKIGTFCKLTRSYTKFVFQPLIDPRNCVICTDQITTGGENCFACSTMYHSKCLENYRSSVKKSFCCPTCKKEPFLGKFLGTKILPDTENNFFI